MWVGLRGSGLSAVWGCFPRVGEGAGRKGWVLFLLGGGPAQIRGPELLQLSRSQTGEDVFTEKEGTRARGPAPALHSRVSLLDLHKACSGCLLSSAQLHLEVLMASLNQ